MGHITVIQLPFKQKIKLHKHHSIGTVDFEFQTIVT